MTVFARLRYSHHCRKMRKAKRAFWVLVAQGMRRRYSSMPKPRAGRPLPAPPIMGDQYRQWAHRIAGARRRAIRHRNAADRLAYHHGFPRVKEPYVPNRAMLRR